ncbi:methylated-DNA--[protein]-cysteine S-methyltransferase [Microbacteriaceae bacterium K1510]|nr:methylated-DNA--[protein]-cysteine S-methyltransferase [Microbacteriaceae bacterium K1510]
MNLMISQKPAPLTPVAAPIDVSPETISYATAGCALGQVLIARSVSGVSAILLGDNDAALEAELAGRFREAKLAINDALVRDDLSKVIRFIDSPHRGLYLPLDMRGTAFQCRVWEKLRSISVGRTVTYSQVANWVGPFTSPRAVAGACAANPLAIAIPCHRVVRADGGLADYHWGIERKRELIRREAQA